MTVFCRQINIVLPRGRLKATVRPPCQDYHHWVVDSWVRWRKQVGLYWNEGGRYIVGEVSISSLMSCYLKWEMRDWGAWDRIKHHYISRAAPQELPCRLRLFFPPCLHLYRNIWDPESRITSLARLCCARYNDWQSGARSQRRSSNFRRKPWELNKCVSMMRRGDGPDEIAAFPCSKVCGIWLITRTLFPLDVQFLLCEIIS